MTEAEELELLELENEASQRTPNIIGGEEVKETPPISQIESGARGLGQGITFGFSDEAIAGLRRLAGGDYDELLKEERLKNELARKANPLTYGASELGGGIATSFIPGLGVAKGASVLKNIGTAAAGGALSGVGYSEGDLEDRAKGAMVGGGVSAALGGAGSAITKGMQSLAPRLAETATGATGKELQYKFKPGSGEKLLERGTVGWFSSPKSIAKKATQELSQSSNEIGKSLEGIDQVSKDQIMANLFTERAKLAGNEANRTAISKLDKEIEAFSKSPSLRDAQDIWNVKKGYEAKVNWMARQQKPGQTQANEKVATALRRAVTDVAADQSPELAKKFAEERQLFSLYKPIKEAAERKAATIQQRDIGGMLDTIALTGGISGDLFGGGEGRGTAAGLGMAGLRRGIVPRIPSFAARTMYSPTLQNTILRAPVSTYRSILQEQQ